MKKYLALFLVAFITISCGKKHSPATPSENHPADNKHLIEKFDTQQLVGEYIGRFGKNNTLILSINYINGKNVSGYNIVKGKRRNVKGFISEENNQFKFELYEPGSDPTDGSFVFSIDPKTFVAEGIWTPNNTTSLAAKDFRLEKRTSLKNSDVTGYWYLDGMRLELKADGSCIYQGWDENAEVGVPVKGTWVEKDNKLTIEWAKNTLFKYQILELFVDTTEYGEPVLIDKNKEERGYRFW
ncbi:MAG: hypothetical protein N2167_06675 [Flavobacteriales bacterium]|nr:hypothetical protein [Flavobacteriales bacterium]